MNRVRRTIIIRTRAVRRTIIAGTSLIRTRSGSRGRRQRRNTRDRLRRKSGGGREFLTTEALRHGGGLQAELFVDTSSLSPGKSPRHVGGFRVFFFFDFAVTLGLCGENPSGWVVFCKLFGVGRSWGEADCLASGRDGSAQWNRVPAGAPGRFFSATIFTYRSISGPRAPERARPRSVREPCPRRSRSSD